MEANIQAVDTYVLDFTLMLNTLEDYSKCKNTWKILIQNCVDQGFSFLVIDLQFVKGFMLALSADSC